jgi:hypothetical protein
MEQPFQPLELIWIVEDVPRDRRAVGAVPADYIRAEPFDQRLQHVGIFSQQPVHDRVARDRRCAVACEGSERFALTGADPAGDRNSRCATAAR